MNYTLNKPEGTEKKGSFFAAAKKLWPMLREEKKTMALAGIAILVNSFMQLAAPYLIGRTIDEHIIRDKDFHAVLVAGGMLLGMYIVALIASYLQTQLMGGVGQRMLFRLRNAVFSKLQELPVAFFNQNKSGDLISRINNDTDKLNQFFSQSLMQFLGNIFIMTGAAIFLVVLHPMLGSVALAPFVFVLIFTQLTGGWVKRQNAKSLKALGGMSSEIQESLANFKAIIAFNRRDYFRERFQTANEENYKTSVGAGIANNIYTPIYGLATSLAQVGVIAFGIWLITTGNFTLGLLISFLAYVNNFYTPLRQMAAIWANYQVALAGWDRIAEILSLDTDLLPAEATPQSSNGLLEFKNVKFGYPDGKVVLHGVNFILEQGKTYALVGPTGGGKTTTASLMARLFDPTEGTVLLDGRDIRSYSNDERTKKIGFILQEPYLFAGTLLENIFYGHPELEGHSKEELEARINEAGLGNLMTRFDQGTETQIATNADAMSLGQRQIIAFMRAVLRKPELLILDEATANIDTVTEQLLGEILEKLPSSTTRVVIAHRLNTIENADTIFFVNGGEITRAGSLDQAVEMLMHGNRQS
ncbi:MAG: ABC transporter ATP-binding protein [Patescibacteria group bacterium]